jgi:hypothetical protein
MAIRCATLEEFLAGAPEFLNFGEQSDGTLTVASQPDPGDSLILATRFGVPTVVEVYDAVAATPGDGEFLIGADETATAANIATALNGGTLVAASSSGPVVSILSGTGPVGSLALASSNPAALTWDESPMTPGVDIVQTTLDCVCKQISLDCFAEKADCAHRYLTAHFLAMQGGGAGEGGAVSSKGIDKLSISYAVTPPSDGDLGGTKWGRMYTQLKRSIFILPIVGRC